jgi:hypothetical protein
MTRLFSILALVAGLFALTQSASAAGNKFTFPLTCDGTTYQVTVSGNGQWTPARDTDSTVVFHPTAFGEFTGTFTPSDGSDPINETDPPEEFQAQPSNGHETVDCSYQISFTEPDGTFEGSGTASGFLTGTRNNH